MGEFACEYWDLKGYTTHSWSPIRSAPNSILIFFQRGDDSYVFAPLVPFFFCVVLVVLVLGAALKKRQKIIIINRFQKLG